jgi:hypothetical protein
MKNTTISTGVKECIVYGGADATAANKADGAIECP